jgi:hypothetical protein
MQEISLDISASILNITHINNMNMEMDKQENIRKCVC